MDIIARLNEFVNSNKITPSQFADKLGIPRPSMSQILSGRNKKISNEFLSKLHYAYPDVDILWLLFGEAPMAIQSEQPNALANSATDNQSTTTEPGINKSEPTLFDDNGLSEADASYANIQTGTTDTVCESVIEDLGKSAPYFHVVVAPDPSASQPQSQNIVHSPNNASIQTDAHAEDEVNDAEKTAYPTPTTQQSNRIESIIVYYTDKTYEVFKPE